MFFQRITIVKISKPRKKEINEELQWFGNSLGLFSLRDKDKSCFRIFIELLKAARAGILLSSDELAARTGLSRGTVVHHLNRLMEGGIIISKANKYMLRVDNLGALIDELQDDIKKTVRDLREIAGEIDKNL